MTRIEFRGYKRLLDTSCNVDAHLIALVGPNEAGKTTVLEALEWLSSGGELDQRKVNRTLDPDLSEPVVTAVLAVEPGDRDALADVKADITPRSVRYSRFQDGELDIRFEPPVTRPSAVGNSVLQEARSPELSQRVQEANVQEALSHVIKLAESGREWVDGDRRAIKKLTDWLELPVTEAVDTDAEEIEKVKQPPQSDINMARLLKVWQEEMAQPHPHVTASEIIRKHLPDLLLFGDADRKLGFEYDLRSRTVNKGGKSVRVPGADVTKPDGGLANLLQLGRTGMREIYDLVQRGVPERTVTHLRAVNKQLNEAITPYWRQRDLRVSLDVSGTTLRVYIEDGEDTARFTDRSDGLRTFVALIAFLAQHAVEPPPILLIDEADIHLHYDAQADLINFLQELPSRTIYTTHSPGCLPLDLGTGVRVVRPDPDTAVSALGNNFWEADKPGLSPLLFAMGAGAAAFSALRAAVFTEGPSDMMLLPSLLREATGLKSLGYQVVPGLASIHPGHLGQAEFEAVRVAYLLDGDEGGDQHEEDLKKVGVPKEKVLRLATGVATEDLVDPGVYLEAVNGVLADTGRSESVTIKEVQAAIDRGTPIGKAVEDQLGGHRHAPSKVAVAGRLLQRHSPIPLAAGARSILKNRHQQLASLLKTQGPQ